jgi:hypothetical protein
MEINLGFWAEFNQLLFGRMTAAYMTVALIFIVFGAALMMYINVLQRDRESDSTPYRFSWQYWIRANWWRPMANIAVSFIAIRFFREFTGMKVNMFFCFCIGLAFDYVLIMLREFSFMLRKKMGMQIDKYKEANELAKEVQHG